MPEGDVLKITSEKLGLALVGAPLVDAQLRWPSVAGANLIGATVISAASYGKHILLRFDDGRTLHTHLRMEGFWKIARTGTPAARGSVVAKYSHQKKESGANGGPLEIRVVLANENWTALGVALGMLDLIPTAEESRLLGHLGPDILAPDFPTTGAVLGAERLLAYADWPICAALLEQRVVAGIGTIWMAETLWTAKLYPWRLVSELDDAERIALLRTASSLVQRSVEIARVRGFGAVPRRAHGQHRKFCVRCQTPIKVSALSGPDARPDQGSFDRIVFWCPTCQAP